MLLRMRQDYYGLHRAVSNLQSDHREVHPSLCILGTRLALLQLIWMATWSLVCTDHNVHDVLYSLNPNTSAVHLVFDLFKTTCESASAYGE